MIELLYKTVGPAGAGILGLWAAINYSYVGPEIASRMTEVDYLPNCVTTITEVHQRAAKKQQCDLANAAVGWFLPELKDVVRGDLLCKPLEQPLKELADRIGAQGGAPDRGADAGAACRCAAEEAVAQSRTDWALYTASVGLIQTERLRDFEGLLDESIYSGRCRATASF